MTKQRMPSSSATMKIHAIYVEIGVSVGVGVALSFVTFGFGGAVAAANATRLAAQAIRIAGRLGGILRRIGTAFRRLRELARTHKFITNVAINTAGNTGGSIAGAAWSGGSPSGEDLKEAAWQGALGAVVGTGPGLKAASMFSGKVASGAAGGIVGNVTGGLGVDGVRLATGDIPFTGEGAKEVGADALVNVIGGGIGGAAVGGAGHLNRPTEGLQVPENFTPAPERTGSQLGDRCAAWCGWSWHPRSGQRSG
ncbi:hypothetical protein [Streptomyces sp. ISL-100]|uniref:hypothetical protein n=1 Tax=Streptomyces sp. ISL-100 TaxID=2819173 RepID=UPI00203627E6|nr:hypothetical protein [Streptomyces sp. ISL-100]